MSPLAAVVSAGIAELVGSEALLAPGSVLADVLVWLLSFEFLPVHAAIEKAATSTSDIVIKRIESLSLLKRKSSRRASYDRTLGSCSPLEPESKRS
jgi:hypothetical protein